MGETKLLKMIEYATNSQGFWQCDHMPGDVDEIVIVLRHPDYVYDLVVQGTEQEPSIEELHNLTSVLVMEKGFDVSGIVLDVHGQPIKKARVLKGPYRFLSAYHKNETYTDDQGKFKFINIKTGKMILTTKADGFASALKEIIVHKETTPVEFRLQSGYTIRGRIIDSNDKPVENVLVTADKWRRHRSIDWQSNTDYDGYFEWNNAPLDEVLFNVSKKGYMSICDLPMSCESEYVIKIYQPLRISGKVVNAETGEPIDNFKLIYMVNWGDTPLECPLCGNSACLESVPFYPFTSGRYELSFDHPADEYRFRIEADGYIPVISPDFEADACDVVFDLELKKGKGPSGTVYLHDGRSTTEAMVIMCKSSQGASISNTWITKERHTQFFETGPDGRFFFPPQAETYLLVVLADQGYTEVTDEKLKSSQDIKIKPWARVEGLLYVGDKPAAYREVFVKYTKIHDHNNPLFEYEYSTETDTNGFFEFDSVPPGRVQIGRLLRLSTRVTSPSHVTNVNLKPGQTLNVTIGGSGRPVIGKVILPANYKAPINFFCSYNSIRLRQPESQKTEDMEQNSYAFEINSDGTFRIEDIPTGIYDLRISLHERFLKTYGSRGDCIGQVNYDFVIPKIVDGFSNEPFDIGTLELEMY
jgi:protocatechuate 3,4-dioxygenase beta subunit